LFATRPDFRRGVRWPALRDERAVSLFRPRAKRQTVFLKPSHLGRGRVHCAAQSRNVAPWRLTLRSGPAGASRPVIQAGNTALRPAREGPLSCANLRLLPVPRQSSAKEAKTTRPSPSFGGTGRPVLFGSGCR
jgi:hypothetical protein